MIRKRAKPLSLFAVLAVALATGGCGGTRFYRSGRAAEKKGDSATAYKEYCLAAERYRSNEIVVNGLARVRPAVAAQAERTGLAAMDDGRYDDAWRCFMRALDIQPDHATAAQLVRQLENDHSGEIASAKRDWIKRGSASLSVPEQAMLAMETTAPRKKSLRETISADVPKESDSEINPSQRPPPQPKRPQPADLEPNAPTESAFTSIHTLSLKDRRYTRLALAADGIGVRLKDTEGDGEADLDLFDGKKVIQKVRDLERGRSQTFRGKSGTLYRLTLLSVHHKSRTVRLGVKRA